MFSSISSAGVDFAFFKKGLSSLFSRSLFFIHVYCEVVNVGFLFLDLGQLLNPVIRRNWIWTWKLTTLFHGQQTDSLPKN